MFMPKLEVRFKSAVKEVQNCKNKTKQISKQTKPKKPQELD